MLVLAGCSGGGVGAISQLAGGVIYSSPQAGKLRACAALADVATPGFSPLALSSLLQGASGNGVSLGSTPAEALENCAAMLRLMAE